MQSNKIGAVEAEKYSNTVTARQQSMVEDQAEKDKKAEKKTTLIITGLKNNMIALKKIYPLESSSNISLQGRLNNNLDNEDVFEVVAKGKQTDDYVTTVEVGDQVMVSNLAIIKFKAATEAMFSSGEFAGMFYLSRLSDVELIVDYKKK